MSKLTAFVLSAAIILPAPYAFAGASNPMSQSYDASNHGKTMTGRADVNKSMEKTEKVQKSSKKKH
mgnify:CR=1 FL=1